MRARPDRLEQVLLGSRLWLGAFANLNDPFEASVPWRWEAPAGAVRAYAKQYMAEHAQEFLPGTSLDKVVEWLLDRGSRDARREAVRAHVLDLGVTCFTEPWDDVPLWTYYGGEHRGVCLRFQATRLMPLEGCFPPMRVTYATRFPAVPFFQSTWFRLVKAIIATKARAWRHEHEWRIVRYEGHGEVPFSPDALDGIILGCRMSEADRTAVGRIVAQRATPTAVFQAAVGNGYNLTSTPA